MRPTSRVRLLVLPLLLSLGAAAGSAAWAQADSVKAAAQADSAQRAAPDTTRHSVFEQQAQDPYLARYGRPPGEGWIPLPNTRTEIRFPGFIQMSYIYDVQNAGFQFGEFITALIPVPTDETSNTEFDPRTSRFSFETRTNTEEVGAVRTVFDMDLYGNGATTSLGFRVRQAYVTWVGRRTNIAVTAGRAFSTYADLAAWPTIADLEGPNAMVVTRQGLLRGSRAFGAAQNVTLDLSLEQPQTAVARGTGLHILPDLAVRFTWRPSWGHLTVMGLARQLVAEDTTGGGWAAAFGNGLSLSGSWYVPGTRRDTVKAVRRQDVVQFQLQGGSGTGRYVSDLGSIPGTDAVYDAAAQELLPLSQWGGFVAYGHYWAKRWRSQFVFSFEHLNNRSLQADDFYHEGVYMLANVAWRAYTRMTLALEYTYGRRWRKDGMSGHANRVMAVLNYGF